MKGVKYIVIYGLYSSFYHTGQWMREWWMGEGRVNRLMLMKFFKIGLINLLITGVIMMWILDAKKRVK